MDWESIKVKVKIYLPIWSGKTNEELVSEANQISVTVYEPIMSDYLYEWSVRNGVSVQLKLLRDSATSNAVKYQIEELLGLITTPGTSLCLSKKELRDKVEELITAGLFQRSWIDELYIRATKIITLSEYSGLGRPFEVEDFRIMRLSEQE